MIKFSRKFELLAIGLIILQQLGCTNVNKKQQDNIVKPSLRDRIAAIPAMNLKNYKFDKNSSLGSRISQMPDFVLDYCKKMDGRNYSSHTPDENEISLVEMI